MSNTHILHIASGDLWAGAEAQLFTLCKQLNRDPELEVSVALMNHGILSEKLCHEGINVNIYDENKYNALQIIFLLRKLLHKTKPDIIHSHRRKENILISIANLLTKWSPSVRTVHGSKEHEHAGLKGLYQTTIDKLDIFCGRYLQKAIIAVTDTLKSELKQDFEKKKIYVINNGIDCQQFPQKPLSSLTKENLDIGIIGRIEAVKRIDIFLETAKLILARNTLPCHFHIYGDGSLKDMMQKRNKENSTESNVSFHGHKNNIAEILASLDIVIMCSDHEGMPMTALEAISTGTIIIANSVGGLKDLLNRGDSYFLVNSNTAQAYTEKIEFIGKHFNNSHKKFNTLRSDILQYYSAENNALQTKELYKKILHA